MHTPVDSNQIVARAMVLAAGLGTRMRPLTETVPKPLVPLAGKPLIDHALDRLADAGVEEAVVNVHHLADAVERHVAGRNRPVIRISDERRRLLDTGGGIRNALPLLGGGPFYVVNCDSIWIEGAEAALERMRRAWDDDAMDCLMLLASTVTSVGYSGPGDFHMDETGRLRRRAEDEIAPFALTGVYMAHPRLLEATPDGPFSMNLVWDRAIADGRLFGIRHDGIWMHVGTPAALAEAERMLDGG